MRRYGLCVAIALGALAFFSASAEAGTRRALLVGIDSYQPEVMPADVRGRKTYSDLKGAVADAESMREILVARYGFAPEDIRFLTDAEATREQILTEFRTHLIESSGGDDVALFYYAGHGSWVQNSKTDEPDGRDESIVPADSHKGALDIRDKELARLYHKVLDKGALLTVILDSCHSGSSARGLPGTSIKRQLSPDPRDAADPPDPGPTPEERGALVLTAAQDYQTADELLYENDEWHGLFTSKLVATLRSVPINESAERLYLKTKALMQAEGSQQDPVLGGPQDRRARGLFGSTSDLSGRIAVAVRHVEPAQGIIELQGGLAAGLNVGSELVRAGRTSDTETSQTEIIRIRVTEASGMSRSEAIMIEGEVEDIKPGDLFELEGWVAPDAANLRVWVPAAALELANLQQMAKEAAALRNNDRLQWSDDPTIQSPTHILTLEGKGWKLTTIDDGRTEDLGSASQARATLDKRASASSDTMSLFVQLPPPVELTQSLRLGRGTTNNSIELTASPEGAHYHLVGRIAGEDIQYGWIRPGATADDELATLPVRTDWITASGGGVKALARQLEKFALQTGRLRAWLQLESPPDRGRFPYHLALQHTGSGEHVTESPLVEGEQYRLVLQLDSKPRARDTDTRYVYVFALDSFGNSTLLFPRGAHGGVENRLPNQYARYADWPPTNIPLGSEKLTIKGPFGIDTFVMLTTTTPIADTSVFQLQGVRTRDFGAPGASPLDELLGGIGLATRGERAAIRVDWSIRRLSLRTVPKTN